MEHQGETTRSITALLVEDNPMIAMDIEDILLAHGIEKVRLATTLEDADHHLTETIDLAVLDFTLGSDTTENLALRMQELGIPFLFVSGFAEKLSLQQALKETPIVVKPFQPEDLMAAINALLFQLRET
ncbi:MAG: response regulator [Rhizobiales bacterium]|nr:response regulator [Hyphomicrobiales bacterium]MBO6698614.1 response regulator [Hyphomicrobiales bacterium]MBO6735133.1 response regulator [Hyphomicrobiales bacterium]MBO6911060.1 response regulator [Hyphomicrobiales bacterium]MBO6956429.1 response regulator [Hyphomicrobiales bacterium]